MEKLVLKATSSNTMRKKTRKLAYVSKSNLRYIHPSFLKIFSGRPTLRGIESLGNVLGNKVVFFDYIGSSDVEALKRDWMAVGNDMRISIRKIKK